MTHLTKEVDRLPNNQNLQTERESSLAITSLYQTCFVYTYNAIPIRFIRDSAIQRFPQSYGNRAFLNGLGCMLYRLSHTTLLCL